MKKNFFANNGRQNTALLLTSFQTFLQNSSDMIFIKDHNLAYAGASDLFVKMTGKTSVEEILGKTDLEIFEDENLARRYMADDQSLLANGQDLIDYIEPLTDNAGYARYAQTSKYILMDDAGNFQGILGISKDITSEYIVRQHYQQELTYLFELPADTYAAVFIDIDDWRIISQRRQLVGTSTMQPCYTIEKLIDFALESIMNKESDVAEFYRNFSREALHRIHRSGRTTLSFKYQRKMVDSSIRWVFNDIRFLTDPESGHLCIMLTARDIDDEKREELELVSAANLDKMTMLLNRETTIRRIEQILTEEPDHMHALFMLDIDNFKILNDTYGHQIGDDFLVLLANTLQRNFRESDIVGRIGGDEFFALMKKIPDPATARQKAQVLLEAIQNTCALYPSIPLSGSIGISLFPQNGVTFKELYAQADSALYQAKKCGKNQFLFAPL